MKKCEILLIANYKRREMDRLSDYTLNQMSIIESGLINDPKIYPSEKEIQVLMGSFYELRKAILTEEERKALDEI